jgi:hypothetical protein
MLQFTKQLQPLIRRTLPSQSLRTMTGTAGSEYCFVSTFSYFLGLTSIFCAADKTPKEFSDSAPGGMSTSNNPDEIPADAKALEPDAGEEAKNVRSSNEAHPT